MTNEQLQIVLKGFNEEKMRLTEIGGGEYNPTISMRLTEIDNNIKELLENKPISNK